MAFAGHVGLTIDAAAVVERGLGHGGRAESASLLASLFAEELGAVLQVRAADAARVVETLGRHGVGARIVARPNEGDVIRVERAGDALYERARVQLHRAWSDNTWT